MALAFFYAHLGVFGLKLLKLLCSSILIVALAIGISATGASARVQRLTLILSAVAISTQMQFRPQLFTFMMMSVVMMALAIEVYRGRAILWPLIPMFALWANFHGGYIVGLGAMGIAAAVMFVQGWLATRAAWRRHGGSHWSRLDARRPRLSIRSASACGREWRIRSATR